MCSRGHPIFQTNVVGFQLETGERRWYIISCFLAPNDTLKIENAAAALKDLPRGAKVLVAGDLNANLDQTEGYQTEKEIAATLTATILKGMPSHFLMRWSPQFWDGKTWSMVQLGREVRYQTDYILETDRHILRNVAV